MADFASRPLAVTDVETSGLDPTIHELLEIGLVLADPKTLKVIETFNVKVRPEHPEIFDPKAYELNGYNAADWALALPLKEAMAQYNQKTKEAIFCAYNSAFDLPFMQAAFSKTGIKPLMDHHFLDLFSLAWFKLRDKGLEGFKLAEVAKFFGVEEEPWPHRAVNGALTAFEVYKKLISLP